MRDPDNFISRYELFAPFLTSKRAMFNLPVDSFPSGTPNSYAIRESLRIHKISTKFTYNCCGQGYKNSLELRPLAN